MRKRNKNKDIYVRVAFNVIGSFSIKPEES